MIKHFSLKLSIIFIVIDYFIIRVLVGWVSCGIYGDIGDGFGILFKYFNRYYNCKKISYSEVSPDLYLNDSTIFSLFLIYRQLIDDIDIFINEFSDITTSTDSNYGILIGGMIVNLDTNAFNRFLLIFIQVVYQP